uniref:B-cell receptor CD22 n=1 Tax=Anabas testudineus TaxID=64144 RepID=A0A3Q1GWY5_ANATE
VRMTGEYPYSMKGKVINVQKTLWFTKENNNEPVDLRTDPDYTGRVTYQCDEKACTLKITDLRQRDSAVYKFRFITNQAGGRFTGSPGVTLSVTDLQLQVFRSTVQQDSTWAKLKCQSTCSPDHTTYIWYKNGQIQRETSSSFYYTFISPADRVSCAVKGHEKFPSPSVLTLNLYHPNLPSVSVSPSEIVEGSSVTLTCSSDANPAANYTWYKENEESPKASGQIFTITDIRAEHSGNYYCEVQNSLGRHNNTLHLTVVTREFIVSFLSISLNLVLIVRTPEFRSSSHRGAGRPGLKFSQVRDSCMDQTDQTPIPSFLVLFQCL